MTHAFTFSSGLFKFFRDPNDSTSYFNKEPVVTATLRKLSTNILTTPNVRKW